MLKCRVCGTQAGCAREFPPLYLSLSREKENATPTAREKKKVVSYPVPPWDADPTLSLGHRTIPLVALPKHGRPYAAAPAPAATVAAQHRSIVDDDGVLDTLLVMSPFSTRPQHNTHAVSKYI